MLGWDDDMRSAIIASFVAATAEADALFTAARAMIADPASADIGQLFRGHMAGVGSYADVFFYQLRVLADEIGHATGDLGAGASFFDHGWNLHLPAVMRFCPELAADLLPARSNDGVEATELLEPSPNDATDPGWPRTLAGFMRQPRRLPLRAYATDDAAAYVHPFRYQVMTRDTNALWDTGSPRALSRQCLAAAESIDTDRRIVIIQDRFDFRNFCHFLFDGVTRVLHYVDHFGYSDELFVFGGIPGRYQELMAQALCQAARIPPESLYFPAAGRLFRSSKGCVWFSDQKELHTHPAQMAHPRSLAALRGLVDLVPATESSARRIYVSRGDADRRRIVNEDALIAALERIGFVTLQLGKLPVEEQLGLFRHAEIVVAPHGMGLTHIIMGKHIGKVVELFHPQAGTDAYAIVARAAGMAYHHVLGQDVPGTHSDFTVDVDRVLDLLDPNNMEMRYPVWRKNANLLPASRTFAGLSVPTLDPPAVWREAGFEAMIWGQSAHIHRKHDPAANTHVGEWREIVVAPATLYVASCWVWLPEHVTADHVSIRLGDWAAENIGEADLKKPNTWQRISYSAISPKSARVCTVGLHVVGLDGTMLASTCWQFERGLTPTAYVTTG